MYEEVFGFLIIDELNWLIVLLIIVLLLIALFECGKILLSVVIIIVILYLIVVVNNLVVFFILYEFLFVLIMFSILILGYSFERSVAGFIIMFYPFLLSSPTLILLIIIDKQFFLLERLEYGVMLVYYTVCSFIVKFPILRLHYWLPVAHVEASTSGSIILAGILLKIGGLGVWYVVKFLKFIVKLHWLMVGYLLIIIVILFLRDLKIMVAYSSVAHIRFMSYVSILGLMAGSNGRVLMIFHHGIISSLIFWIIGVLGWVKTRSLIVTKLVSFSRFSIAIVIIALLLNMGFPPSTGFLSEILILKSILTLGKLVVFLGLLGVLFSCYHNIFLHWGLNGVSSRYLMVEIKVLNVFLIVLIVISFINYF
jgi:NADH-ubiquinone oxidoreductase chain 4